MVFKYHWYYNIINSIVNIIVNYISCLDIFTGPLSIAVPGEVYGYFEAKNKYGNKNISMISLMQPTIDMCRKGIEVSWSAANTLASSEDLILKDPGMRYTLILVFNK